MKIMTIRVVSKTMLLAYLAAWLVLSAALSAQTTRPTDEPTTQPVLTLEQQISALDSLIDSRVNPPTPDDRAKLAMQRLQLRQQLSQEQAIMNAPRLAAEKAARDAKAAADKAKIEEMKKAIAPAERANLDKQETIATAIKEKRIIDGMTVEQAGKAVSLTFRKGSASSRGEVWGANDAHKVSYTDDLVGTEYTLTVQNGVVVSWENAPCVIRSGSAPRIYR